MTTLDKRTKPVERSLRNTNSSTGGRRFSAVYLLAALGVLFLAAPFLDDLPGGDLIETLLLTAVMLCAVFAVSGRSRSWAWALVLFVPALGGKWANYFFPGSFSAVIYLGAAIVFFAFVVAHLVHFILRASRVDGNVLCAGLSGYLLLGLLWMPAYLIVARLNLSAFNLSSGSATGPGLDRFSAFYFSFMTLCTVGYGDVTPASKVARMLAITEAVAGLFYVAVLISRLVALYSTAPPVVSADDSPSALTPPKP